TDLEYVLKRIRKCRNDVVTEIRQFLESGKDKKIEPIRGLTHLLDNRFSKSQYINTRQLTKDAGSDIFPSYKKIAQAKLDCRPPSHNLKINDISASLPLQALLDHTVSRLLFVQEQVIDHLTSNGDTNELAVKLQLKWSFDSSTNQ